MQINLSQYAKNILNKIKLFYDIKTDGELADFLGVKQNTISSWKKRGNPDYKLILEKCSDIDFNWLFKDEKLKISEPNENYNVENNEVLQENVKLKAQVEILKEILKDKLSNNE